MLQNSELQTALDIARDELLSFKGGLYPVMFKDDYTTYHLHIYFHFHERMNL